jgi:hypothetical protein
MWYEIKKLDLHVERDGDDVIAAVECTFRVDGEDQDRIADFTLDVAEFRQIKSILRQRIDKVLNG